jgi:hypothetical protein
MKFVLLKTDDSEYSEFDNLEDARTEAQDLIKDGVDEDSLTLVKVANTYTTVTSGVKFHKEGSDTEE